MLNNKLLIFITLFLFVNVLSNHECFILKDFNLNKIILKKGQGFEEPISPCSTFKVVLSLVGFDIGILEDLESPKWDCIRDGNQVEVTPKIWIDSSIVRYSQILVSKVEHEKIVSYLDHFDYGNKDVSGSSSYHSGFSSFWLSSSLKISPLGQLNFLSNFLSKKFSLSEKSYNKTRELLFLGQLQNGWDLFGKTGSGDETKPDGTVKKLNWFIGWLERNEKKYIFVLLLRDLDHFLSRDERRSIVLNYFNEINILSY